MIIMFPDINTNLIQRIYCTTILCILQVE